MISIAIVSSYSGLIINQESPLQARWELQRVAEPGHLNSAVNYRHSQLSWGTYIYVARSREHHSDLVVTLELACEDTEFSPCAIVCVTSMLLLDQRHTALSHIHHTCYEVKLYDHEVCMDLRLWSSSCQRITLDL